MVDLSFLDEAPNLSEIKGSEADPYTTVPFQGDPDGWVNKTAVAFNNSQKSLYNSIGLISNEVLEGSDDPEFKEYFVGLKKWADDGQAQQDKDISELGQPRRTASITQGWEELQDLYGEEDGLRLAIDRAGTLLSDMSAEGVGSLALPLAAFAPAAVASLVGAPVVATGALALTLPLLVSAGMTYAPSYNKMIEMGVDKDRAANYAKGIATISGLLDRIGAGFLLNGLVKSFGKDAVVDTLSQEVGKSAARKAVDIAGAGVKAGVKGGLKGGVGEAVTEGTQAVVEDAGTRLAAGLPLIEDDPRVQINNIIDQAAIGFVTGKPLGAATGIINKSLGNDLAVRHKEIDDSIESLQKATEDADNDLANIERLDSGDKKLDPMESVSVPSSIVRSAIQPLKPLANLEEVEGPRIVNTLMSQPSNVSAKVGEYAEKVQPVLNRVKRAFKLPIIQRAISKSVGRRITKVMAYGAVDKNNNINEAAKTLRSEIYGEVISTDPETGDPVYSGMAGEMQALGIPLNFEENYVPISYKTGRRARKKMKKMLIQDGATPVIAAGIIDNIEGNNGFFNPENIKQLNLSGVESTNVESPKAAFENKRMFKPEFRKKLFDAGLIDDNVEALTYKYLLDASKRIEAKKMEIQLKEDVASLIKKDKISAPEVAYISKIYSALNHNYNPIKDKKWGSTMKNILAAQYILTLPLAALQALSEPLIMLTRVSPKHALMGSMKASVNALTASARTIFPKIPQGKSERAFKGIMEGLDGVLSERFGDIGNVTTNKKITDAFFKATGLTLVTQISRDMGFQAARMQMTEDLKTIHKYEGITDPSDKPRKPTREYLNAKKRLRDMGLVNPMSDTLQNWAMSDKTDADPTIVRKAMSKMVKEIIMTPDPTNKPLWMSDPHWALVAQLKGFMATFGTNVGGRMYRDVVLPLLKGRVPAGDIARYSVALTALVGASLAVQTMKEAVRYPEGEEPSKDLDMRDRVIEALLGTNIFGGGTILYDALNANKFGGDFWASLLGPTASTVSSLGTASAGYLLGEDGERSLARELTALVPIIRNIPLAQDLKEDIVSRLEEILEDSKDILN